MDEVVKGLNEMMKKLDELTDAQLNNIIDAAKYQLDLRERTNNERFFKLLQPLKKAAQDILSEFPQAHCYIDGNCIYIEDLIFDGAYWELKN